MFLSKKLLAFTTCYDGWIGVLLEVPGSLENKTVGLSKRLRYSPQSKSKSRVAERKFMRVPAGSPNLNPFDYKLSSVLKLMTSSTRLPNI